MKVNDMKARLLNLEETFKKHESELTELIEQLVMVTTGLTWFVGLVVLKTNLMIAQCNHCSNQLVWH